MQFRRASQCCCGGLGNATLEGYSMLFWRASQCYFEGLVNAILKGKAMPFSRAGQCFISTDTVDTAASRCWDQ